VQLDAVRIHYPDARESDDGAIHLPCPICLGEGHPGKDFTIFANEATSCVRAAGAGRDFNRDHCRPVRETLGLGAEKRFSFITSALFEGERQITLELDRVNKFAQFLTARNCKDVLHSAELRMSKPDERAAFVAAIPDRDDVERQTIARELVQMLDRFRKTQDAVDKDSGSDGNEKESAATRLVQLANEAHLIHNADGDGFAVMMVDGHKETWLLRSKGFKRWLQRKFFERYEKAPGSQAVHDALGVIEGKALYDGPERRIFVRIGEKDGKIYLDLADDKWRAIEIDADGWRVVDIPPIEFKRAKGMLPLPVPERGGSIEELRPFMNLENGDLWTLLLGSIVMKLRPRGPYNIDVFTGRQGCGKTTRARVVRALVDPSSADTRSAPREQRDLQIAASNEWLPIFDNLSRIPEWLSDGFCCMSTGGAMRTRELYSDADEAIFAAMRPVMLTSITEVVERPDMLDRSIIYDLPEIEKKKRKTEKELWAEFGAARPRILGAMLDAVSCALRNEDAVVIKDPSRMADFERWATAAEPALGLKHGTFLRAYRKNQNSANDLALEACPIADYITELAEKHKTWLGKAKELFDLLFDGIDDDEKRKRKEQGWPKTPTVLSATLRRIAPNLKMHGVELTFNLNEGKRKRLIKIEFKSEPPPDDPPEPQEPDEKTDTQDYAGKSAYPSGDAYSDIGNKGVNEFVEYALNDSEYALEAEEYAHGSAYSESQSADSNKQSAYSSTPANSLESIVEYAGTQEYSLLHTQSDGSENLDTEHAVDSIVALDCETEEFDDRRGITPRNARILGLSISHDGEGQTSYTEDASSWAFLMPEPETIVAMHHAKFDLLKLQQAGLPVPERWECSMIASHLLAEEGNHGLKELVKEHFDVSLPTYKEVQRERLFNPDAFNEYAKNDSRFTFKLWQKFETEIERQGLRRIYELEKALVPVVMAMEERGMLVDVDALKRADAEMKSRLAQLEADIHDLAGCHFNINSSDKLGVILKDRLNLELRKTTSTGKPSLDKGALKELAGQHPIIPLLIEYRELDKLAGAFISEMPQKADEDGRVHPTFNQLGATSGRFTCSNPNIQQLPRSSGNAKVLRAAFIAGPGRKLVCADWSQVELRIIAHFSKDKAMNEAFASGADLHTRTASLMFNKPESGVTKEQRSAAKAINFGIAYGMGAPGLFKSLNASGINTSLDECKKFVAAYHRSYPGIGRFLNAIKSQAWEQGYAKTLFGRRRRLAADGSNELSVKNAVIQGSGADVAKDAMVRLHVALPKEAHLIAMIHDEFVVECLEEQAEEVRALMVEIMGKQPEGFTVPLLVDAHIGDNWGECK
jgi:DNA polymerase I-like protein with 3'-5' exonuclease and polymerase domains